MARLLLILSLAIAQVAQAEGAPNCPTTFAALARPRHSLRSEPVEPVWQKNAWGEATLHYTGFVLRKEDYEAFKEAAMAVNQISGSNPVIAIGRSPAPVSAILSIVDENRIANLPISDFRHRIRAVDKSESLPSKYEGKEKSFEPLSPELEKKLFEHFDNTLAAFLKTKKGTVFLTDVGESGASLFSMQQYLQAYAAQRGFAVNFESILLTNSFFSSNVDHMASYFGVRTNKIVLDGNKFVGDSLKSSPWDRFAEYDGYMFDDIAKSGKTTAYSPLDGMTVDMPSGKANADYHDRFKSAVLVNMATDPKLLKIWKNPPIVEVDVPGINWDSAKKVYRDESGKIWKLRTD